MTEIDDTHNFVGGAKTMDNKDLDVWSNKQGNFELEQVAIELRYMAEDTDSLYKARVLRAAAGVLFVLAREFRKNKPEGDVDVN